MSRDYSAGASAGPRIRPLISGRGTASSCWLSQCSPLAENRRPAFPGRGPNVARANGRPRRPFLPLHRFTASTKEVPDGTVTHFSLVHLAQPELPQASRRSLSHWDNSPEDRRSGRIPRGFPGSSVHPFPIFDYRARFSGNSGTASTSDRQPRRFVPLRGIGRQPEKVLEPRTRRVVCGVGRLGI